MGRRTIRWTEALIRERILAGFGRGTGASYKPWLTVRDLSSRGTSTRLYSHEVGRALTFLSNIERNAFLKTEYDACFADYWEQYPIPRSASMAIAAELGIRHPVYPGTKVSVVMTLDGVATRRTPKGEVRAVLDCKPASELAKDRVKQKLAIHEEFAKRQGWKYTKFTDESASREEVHNIQWMKMSITRAGESASTSIDIQKTALNRQLMALAHSGNKTAVIDVLMALDSRQDLTPGASLHAFKQLLWEREIDFDLSMPFGRMLRAPVANLKPGPRRI